MANDPIYDPSKFAEDASAKFAKKYPHRHDHFATRPHLSRRNFFQLAGAGVVGSYLAQPVHASEILSQAGAVTQNKAKYCIYIHLQGAISHLDTFDLKVTNGVTPSKFAPALINGINFPTGLLPKLATQVPNLAIVRSVSAWALVHTLATQWAQIGRNPVAALGDIAPNIGSVVAIEKDVQRTSTQVFPAFVALNTSSGAANGYFPATYAPFRVAETSRTTSTGVNNTTNVTGQTNFNTMFSRLHTLDDPLRKSSPYGQSLSDYDAFYSLAQKMMYNNDVTTAFNFTVADSQRYGSSSFGNACLVAKQVLAANQGTRYVQITYGSWDMHNDIYGNQNPNGNNLFTLSPAFDDGVSALLTDLKSSGLLDQTLIVMVGEFGRTPTTEGSNGRDHNHFGHCMWMAGAGVRPGMAYGATDDFGFRAVQGRVHVHDLHATILHLMGLDHEQLTYRYAGRDYRLTDIAGRVVHEVLG